MIEVFKTDVTDPYDADIIIDQIQTSYAHYQANFDLQDCDNILRIKSTLAFIESQNVISLLKNLGFSAEVLPDERAPGGEIFLLSLQKDSVHG